MSRPMKNCEVEITEDKFVEVLSALISAAPVTQNLLDGFFKKGDKKCQSKK